jgi:nicotinamidase-related amidase
VSRASARAREAAYQTLDSYATKDSGLDASGFVGIVRQNLRSELGNVAETMWWSPYWLDVGSNCSQMKALLLVDFQKDFLASDGRMPVDQGQVRPVIEAAQRAVDNAHSDGDLIVKIGNEFRRSDMIGNAVRHHAAMQGSPGATWDRRIDPPGAMYVPKWKSNAFCNPDLAALLEEADVTQVRLAGLFAKACVSATAKGARNRKMSVQVIGDATACSSDTSRRRALERLRRIGIEVV